MYRFILILCFFLLIGCHEFPSSSNHHSTEKKVNTLNRQLFDAAEKGNTNEVLKLLKAGANIDATNRSGTTPVLAATYHNRVETVKLLINQGADIDIRDDSLNNVLLYAGAEGLLEIVKLSIEAGADTNLTNRFGGTALIPAAERGHVNIVKELLTHSDTDVNHINNLHWTALLEAVILGDGGEDHQEIVKLLVDHGADIDMGDREGITALQHAQNNGYQDIVAILSNAKSAN